jgi:hypothetical protein
MHVVMTQPQAEKNPPTSKFLSVRDISYNTFKTEYLHSNQKSKFFTYSGTYPVEPALPEPSFTRTRTSRLHEYVVVVWRLPGSGIRAAPVSNHGSDPVFVFENSKRV